MHRSQLIPWLAVLFCSLSATLAATPPTPVLLVTIDTLRADRLRPSLMPSLSALASDGIRFTRAFSQVPITLPSHTSILTGSYPMYHGVRDFGGFKLGAERETLAEVLHREGYRTAAFVSSFALDSSWGIDQGFDLYHDNFDLSHYRGIGFNAVERRGDETVDLALAWLQKNATGPSGPFFLWVHLFDPHDPYQPPEPYASRFSNPYDGEVAFADAQLGRLLEAFKQKSLYHRLLIVVLGDHGEGLGEHGEETHGFFVYNSTLHVPLVVKLPGEQFAGRVVEQVVETVDVAPTVLQVLRLRSRQMQGRGLLGLLRGGHLRGGEFAYGESYYAHYHFGWSALSSYQDARYKYVRAPHAELYDLRTDPGEVHNLLEAHSALAHQYSNRLADVRGKFADSAPAQKAVEIDEAARQRLQSLGYVAISAGRGSDPDEQGLADPKEKIALFNAIRRATLETEKGNYGASVSRLAKVIRQDPEIYTARYLQGFNFFRTRRFMQAVEEFKAAVRLFPDSHRAIHSLAMSYLRLGMNQEAALGFEHLTRLQPANPEGFVGLGDVYLEQRKLEAAEREYRRALELGRSSGARLGLGRVLVARGRLDEGIRLFKEVLKADPASAEAHWMLALAYRKKGMASQSRQHLEKARALGARIPR